MSLMMLLETFSTSTEHRNRLCGRSRSTLTTMVGEWALQTHLAIDPSCCRDVSNGVALVVRQGRARIRHACGRSPEGCSGWDGAANPMPYAHRSSRDHRALE
jgi:hypothetical protein